jgi:hypothetical protein
MTIASLTPDVAAALEEIRLAFPHSALTVDPDSSGGARIILEQVHVTSPLFQDSTWVGFYITHAYPYADIYPHYVRADFVLSGQPNAPLAKGHEFLGRAAIMVSRRSNRHNPATDTALLKLQKVLEWLDSQK